MRHRPDMPYSVSSVSFTRKSLILRSSTFRNETRVCLVWTPVLCLKVSQIFRFGHVRNGLPMSDLSDLPIFGTREWHTKKCLCSVPFVPFSLKMLLAETV